MHTTNKMENKIGYWNLRQLSQARRLVMINSVLLALPIYMVSCYKIPYNIIRKDHYSISKFWQNQNSHTQRRITWDSFGTISLSKLEGGLGLEFKILNVSIKQYLLKIDGIFSYNLQAYGQ